VPERLCRDVFPAEVLLPGGRLIQGCRVFVTSSRVLVYQASERQIELAAEFELTDPINASRSTLQGGRLELHGPDGTSWVNQGRGCGCHSPLRDVWPMDSEGAPIAWGGR
jgi:hypothetical protein